MSNRLYSALSVAALLWVNLVTPQVFAKKPKEYVIYAHRPDYPPEARRLRLEGSGIYAMNIRSDGIVESVAVTKSSGHPILDRAAAAALLKWRYHSTGAKRVVTTPMAFTMKDYRGR
ncbi:MAG: energy transducer TonB [Gemmatimonadaceae bacterium]